MYLCRFFQCHMTKNSQGHLETSMSHIPPDKGRFNVQEVCEQILNEAMQSGRPMSALLPLVKRAAKRRQERDVAPYERKITLIEEFYKECVMRIEERLDRGVWPDPPAVGKPAVPMGKPAVPLPAVMLPVGPVMQDPLVASQSSKPSKPSKQGGVNPSSDGKIASSDHQKKVKVKIEAGIQPDVELPKEKRQKPSEDQANKDPKDDVIDLC